MVSNMSDELDEDKKERMRNANGLVYADYHLRSWARYCPQRISPWGLSKEPGMQAISECGHNARPERLAQDRTSRGIPRELNFDD